MPADKLFGRTFDLIDNSLNILAKRHSLIADNIANLDTPDRRAREINFKETLDDAVNKTSIRMTRTDSCHFSSVNPYSGYEEVDMDQPSNGVNWMDIDNEMTKLAENNLMYRTNVEILLRKIAGLKHAITEGGK